MNVHINTDDGVKTAGGATMNPDINHEARLDTLLDLAKTYNLSLDTLHADSCKYPRREFEAWATGVSSYAHSQRPKNEETGEKPLDQQLSDEIWRMREFNSIIRLSDKSLFNVDFDDPVETTGDVQTILAMLAKSFSDIIDRLELIERRVSTEIGH